MRVIILSCFPLIDKLPYKNKVLKGLVERKPQDIALLYVKTKLLDYCNELKGKRELVSKLIKIRSSSPLRFEIKLFDAARESGINVVMFKNFDIKCLRWLRDFRPDIIHNLTGLYIPRAVLKIPRYGVVGAHYADLPRIRGSDTIRWSILLDLPVVVSHMFLLPKLDLGDILLKSPVEVRRGDNIEIIRRKCQEQNAMGHLRVYDMIKAGELAPIKQREEEGSRFYRMGKFLRNKVDYLLSECQYSHYVE